MSNFANNAADYHAVADSHYIGKKAVGMRESLMPSAATSAPPASAYDPSAQQPQDSSYPTLPVRRKPIPGSNQPAAQQGIRRKPVGESTPIPPPAPPAQPAQRSPLPAGHMRTIFTGKDGKIDPATIMTVPTKKFVTPVAPSKSEPQSAPAPAPVPVPAPARVSYSPNRASITSFLGFSKNKRTDTDDSSKLHRTSLADMVKSATKRISGAFKEKVEIVQMPQGEREDWLIAKHEKKLRSETNLLSDNVLVYRDSGAESYYTSGYSSGSGSGPVAQAWARMERKEAALNKPLPVIPADSSNLDRQQLYGTPTHSDPVGRYLARQHGEKVDSPHYDALTTRGRVSPPSLTTGEVVALKISEATDKIKNRGRSNTMDSEMSFADIAPEDTMVCCIRCHRPPEDFVHSSGLCNTCHIYAREQKAKLVKLARK